MPPDPPDSADRSTGPRTPLAAWARRSWGVMLGLSIAWMVLRVHAVVLRGFFGPDDLIHLEQALSVLPPSESPLRFLSQSLYFRLMLATVGPYPPAFHLASVGLHTLNALLLGLVLARAGVAAPVAWLASALFGTSAIHYPTLLFAVNINQIGALTFVLLGMLAATPGGRPVVAIPAMIGAFAIALFWKESVVALLPVVGWMRPPGRRREVLVPVFVLVAAFLALFAAWSALGLAPGGVAYEAGMGTHVPHNIATYVAWILAVLRPLPDRVNSADVDAWRLALPSLVAIVAVGGLLRAQRRHVALGVLWFLLGVVPVSVLVRHAYAHHAYPAVPGLALLVSLAMAALARPLSRGWDRIRAGRSRRPSGRGHPAWGGALCWAVVIACAMVHTAAASRSVEQRAVMWIPDSPFPADPFTRKMTVAARAAVSFGDGWDGTASEALLFALPGEARAWGARTGREYPAAAGREEAYDLLRHVMDDGRAFRVFYPGLKAVHFRDSIVATDTLRAFYLRDVGGTLVPCGVGRAAIERAFILLLDADTARRVADGIRQLSEVLPGPEADRLTARARSRMGEPAGGASHDPRTWPGTVGSDTRRNEP